MHVSIVDGVDVALLHNFFFCRLPFSRAPSAWLWTQNTKLNNSHGTRHTSKLPPTTTTPCMRCSVLLEAFQWCVCVCVWRHKEKEMLPDARTTSSTLASHINYANVSVSSTEWKKYKTKTTWVDSEWLPKHTRAQAVRGIIRLSGPIVNFCVRRLECVFFLLAVAATAVLSAMIRRFVVGTFSFIETNADDSLRCTRQDTWRRFRREASSLTHTDTHACVHENIIIICLPKHRRSPTTTWSLFTLYAVVRLM